VTTASADHVVSRILTLDSIDHHAEIKLYLSSTAAACTLAWLSTMPCRCRGAGGHVLHRSRLQHGGVGLLAVGRDRPPFASPNSRIMLHQTSGGMMGTSADVRVAAENMLKNERLMTEILARHCKRSSAEVMRPSSATFG